MATKFHIYNEIYNIMLRRGNVILDIIDVINLYAIMDVYV